MPIRNTRTRVRFDSRVATLVLLAAFVGVASADAVRKSQIKAQLLAGYDTKTPPEPADGLKVELSIALQQFISVNTAAETLEFSAWWRMRWVDPRLIWDDPDVQFMSFGVSQIWRPDLTIYERIGGAILDTGDVTVTVYPGGNCQVSLPRSDKIGCPMMISSFPWDRQRCNFTVGSWSYTGLALDLQPRQQDVSELLHDGELPDRLPFDLDQYKGFQEFWLARVKTIWKNTFYNLTPEPYPVMQIEFDLYRATESYVAGTFVPLILVTCIGFFTLFMPAPPSGSRPALSVTVMLTTATVYFVASRGTPQSNQSTSIGRIYIYSLCSSFILVAIALLNTSLNLVQPEDKSIRQNLSDFFDKHDKEKKGKLEEEELDRALTSLGLNAQERQQLLGHFVTAENRSVNKAQWTALCNLMPSKDDGAMYHNGLIRLLVHKSMERQLHHSATTLGQDHSALKADQARDNLNQDRDLPVAKNPDVPVLDTPIPPPPSAPVTASFGFEVPDPRYTPRDPAIPLMGWNGTVTPPMGAPDMAQAWHQPTGVPMQAYHVAGHAFGTAAEVAAGGAQPSTSSASLSTVAAKTAKLLNAHVRGIAGPPRAGRDLAAKIDKIARWLMPLGFFIFVTLEFTGVVSGEYIPHGSLDPLKDSDGLHKTRLEFWDYRTGTEPRCYKNFPQTRSAPNQFDEADDLCNAK